jgi:DNA-binding CsgD family transcriptional regulator
VGTPNDAVADRLEALLLAVTKAGAEATGLRDFRERALAALRGAIRFDRALFHALSPRVPLDTAVLVGMDVATVAATLPDWDRLAVDLGRLREVAMTQGGVATDLEAFPRGSAGRARYEQELAKKLGVSALLMAHLVVRGSIRAAVLLFRTRGAFSVADASLLRAVAPALAVADTLQVSLDDAPRAALAVQMKCVDQRLTPRQRDIVEQVAMGHTNEAIARALGLSPNTLRNHLAEAFRRLGAANRADAVRLAVLRPEGGG